MLSNGNNALVLSHNAPETVSKIKCFVEIDLSDLVRPESWCIFFELLNADAAREGRTLAKHSSIQEVEEFHIPDVSCE